MEVEQKENTNEPVSPSKRTRKIQIPLTPYENPDTSLFEIGIDEVGRGPLFGRVYAAAVILPKTDAFKYSLMKDSKKFTSNKKIMEAFDYIKEYAVAWAVEYEDETTIDQINILQATQSAMHKCIQKILNHNLYLNPTNTTLLIDGNYFNSYNTYSSTESKFQSYNHTCIKGGDNVMCCIAAASILAKVSRDNYIEKLCNEHPNLSEHYSIDTNKGYGAKKHIDGIKEHGITPWHRHSFGLCKNYKISDHYINDNKDDSSNG